MQVNTPARARHSHLLSAYLQANKRDARELLKKKAKSGSLTLFKVTLAVAPTPAQIKQDVCSRGWRVKRKARAWPLRKGEKRGSKGPLNRMRAAAIGQRVKAIGTAATGWLPAVYATGGNPGGKRLKTVAKPRGGIEFTNFDSDRPGILIINSTPGIARVQEKHDVIGEMLRVESRDLIQYLRTHGHEKAKAALKGGN